MNIEIYCVHSGWPYGTANVILAATGRPLYSGWSIGQAKDILEAMGHPYLAVAYAHKKGPICPCTYCDKTTDN